MATVSHLSQIDSFGGTDADQDALLIEAFEDHSAFESLKNHKRFCILGRKGSGKTAIFKKMLSHSKWNKFAFGHTFSDYPWHFHEKQKSIGVPEEQCYVQSWLYLCFITLAKLLLNKDSSQPWSETAVDHLARVERFILDSYGTLDPDVTQVFTPSKVLRFSGDVGVDWKVARAGLRVDSIPVIDLPVIVQDLNKNIRDATIESLNPELDYYILFDQLDLGFSLDEKDYSLRIIGLLLAARDINLFAREAGKRLTVGVFLRDDIYDQLQFEDKNKITENFCDYVIWDQGGPRSNTLKSLMERRIQVLFDGKLSRWDEIFDETKEMSGRQRKYNYILDRTFLRPRDMIKFCNEALNALRASENPGEKFSNKNIIAAQAPYSDYLQRELDDEIHKHIPEYREYLEVIKGLDSLQFTFAEFKEAWQARRSLFKSTAEPLAALRELFGFSVIGYLAVGGGGGGAQYVWKYKDPRAQFNEGAAQFRVHPGFKEVLGLKKFTRAD